MKKRLFLLMLTLVSMCPTTYGADHEKIPFESNIKLPLKGERIALTELPNFGYDQLLGLAVCAAVCIPAALIATRLAKRSFSRAMVAVPVMIGGCYAGAYLGRYVRGLSYDRIDSLCYFIPQATAHNRAIGNYHTGMITQDGKGNRVLRMQIQECNGYAYEDVPYEFDKCRNRREEATRGFFNKLLLGPGNLRRISAINEKLNALDNQLYAECNIKPARRS